MKRHLRSLWAKPAAVALALGIAAGAAGAQSVVARLGVSESTAQDSVLSAMGGGYGYYGAAAKSFLALGPAARAMAVNDAVAWAKMYVNSAAFKQEWAKKRDASKPQAPVVSGSASDAVSQSNAATQKQIDDLKKTAASMPADQRAAIEQAIQQIEAQEQAAAKDPNLQALQTQSVAASRAADQKRYQDDLQKWQRDCPADPGPVIAQRLRDFLAMSADVNFDAQLVARSGGKYFADPQYENKPDEWKVCFRAGREATQAARAAATQWLKELGAKP